MKFQIFKDEVGEWRWRLVAKNGKIIADCGEGYKNKGWCVHMAKKLLFIAVSAKIEFLD